MNNKDIRNFCIIAHIDHGKSTLADRLLEFTGTIEKRKMRDQILDQMDLERERGITIKLQPVRMEYKKDNIKYIFNLIDTPGHVDFSYEVSRSLSAVEGALLVVDATQGIEAQTLANLYQALEQNLVIIPIINKIDLPNAEIEKVTQELSRLLGVEKDDIILASAKTGEGIEKIVQRIISDVPSPQVQDQKELRALIFDSYFDEYQGVISLIRIVDGILKKGDKIHFSATAKDSITLSLGVLKPQLEERDKLEGGEIGYLVAGLKSVKDCRVGDTIVLKEKQGHSKLLPGYQEIKPMVYAGLFPREGEDSEGLREALEKLHLSDAAFTFLPEKSAGLGIGFRAGFLGILHLDIIRERLKREYNLEVTITVPSVAYQVFLKNDKKLVVTNPSDFPEEETIDCIKEPWMKVDVITPSRFQGAIMELVLLRRGHFKTVEYLDQNRVILHFELPLAFLIVDFYDKLKSVSQGYASLNYDFADFREANIRRLDILVAGEVQESLATFVYEEEAYQIARRIARTLKEVIPAELFEIRIQAVLGYRRKKGGNFQGGKIIASERISPLRKDVTQKLYGGDVTRKKKLLEKQKKGKKRMRSLGKVIIPSEAYLSVLKGR